MDYIDIGGIRASRLILGSMRIADKPLENIGRLVDTALEIGINTFDHADIYGGGKCEELYGRLIKNNSNLRQKMVLQTKCGDRGSLYDLSKSHIINCVEGSLKRLNTDYLDILLLAKPDPLMRGEEVAAAFDALEKSGKVRVFGLSGFSSAQADYLQFFVNQKLYINQIRLGPAQCPDLCAAGQSDVLYAARKNGVTVQTYGTMQCEFTDETGYFYKGAFTTDCARKKYFALNFTLDGLAQKYATRKEAVAVAWVLRSPAAMQAIIGTTLDRHLKAYKDCCDIPLTNAEWYEIYKSVNILS